MSSPIHHSTNCTEFLLTAEKWNNVLQAFQLHQQQPTRYLLNEQKQLEMDSELVLGGISEEFKTNKQFLLHFNDFTDSITRLTEQLSNANCRNRECVAIMEFTKLAYRMDVRSNTEQYECAFTHEITADAYSIQFTYYPSPDSGSEMILEKSPGLQ